MEAKLNKAVELRIKREDDFIAEIISQINLAIESLDEYDPSNARTAIDLTKAQLSEIIFKLNDVSNMTEKTASIANIVKDKNLMRRPQTVQPPPQAQLQTPPLQTQLQTPPLQTQVQTSPLQTQVQQSQSQVPLSQRPAPLPINPLQVKQQPARQLGTRTMLPPMSGGRRTRRRRKTRR